MLYEQSSTADVGPPIQNEEYADHKEDACLEEQFHDPAHNGYPCSEVYNSSSMGVNSTAVRTTDHQQVHGMPASKPMEAISVYFEEKLYHITLSGSESTQLNCQSRKPMSPKYTGNKIVTLELFPQESKELNSATSQTPIEGNGMFESVMKYNHDDHEASKLFFNMEAAQARVSSWGSSKINHLEANDHVFSSESRSDSKSPIGGFLCTVCNKEFSTNKSRNRHEKTHNEQNKLRCEICNRSFSTNDSLKRHMATHIGEREKLVRSPGLRSQEKSFACNICDKTFVRNDSLRSHMRIHMPGFKGFQCQTCDKTFLKNCNLTRHMQIHVRENMSV